MLEGRARKKTWGALIAALGGIVLTVLAPAPRIHALDMPTYTLRELVVRADVVVRARPARTLQVLIADGTPHDVVSFAVLDVLKGDADAVGTTVDVALMGAYQGWYHTEPIGDQKAVTVREALLFLHRPREDGAATYRPVDSGVLYDVESRQVLRPRVWGYGGHYRMRPEPDGTWAAVVRDVRSHVAYHKNVIALCGIGDVHMRNKAVLEWLELHLDDLGGGSWSTYGKPERGWGSLGRTLFELIMESRIPPDCWRARMLYAKLSPTSRWCPGGKLAPFCSHEGRELLASVAFDEDRPLRERELALWSLSSRRNLWSRRGTRLGAEQQDRLLARLELLLRLEPVALRRPAVRALYNISFTGDGSLKHRDTQQSLPALLEAYRAEPPGEMRDELAVAVRRIGGVEVWRAATGNPAGLLVRLNSFRYREDSVIFGFHHENTPARIFVRPTVVFTPVGPGAADFHSRRVPMPGRSDPGFWAKGHEAWHNFIEVTVPTADLPPGRWRVHVEGVVGEGEATTGWRSEPREFTVADRATG